MIGGANDRLFGILCQCLGKPEWAEDERFATNSSRVENRVALEKDIEDITMSKSTQAWLDIFDGTGLPYAKVNDLMDTLQHTHGQFPPHELRTWYHDPSNTQTVVERDMVKEIDHASLGKLKVLNSPVKYSRSGPSIRTAPPLLGEHTKDVLQEILGMDDATVDKLIEEGVASSSAKAK